MVNEMIKKAMKENYTELYDISEKNKEKLIELLTMLACRFYVEENLDASVIEEMLYENNLDYSIKNERENIAKY